MNLLITASIRPALGVRRPLHRKVQVQSLAEDIAKKVEASIVEDPKTLEAVERITTAANKVADVRNRQLEIEAAIAADALEQEERKISVRNVERDAEAQIAEAEVKRAQMLLKAAELEAKIISQEKAEWINGLVQDAERTESGKAATAAVVGGLVGSVPLALTSADDALVTLVALGGSLATCALFGVVYRYIVRSDKRSGHLVGGAVSAFGLSRGLALVEGQLRAADAVTYEVLAQAALAAGQSMLIVGFAAVAMEYALAQGIVARFGEAASREDLLK